MYLASWTRPDIMASMNFLSQHASKPLQKHWDGIKRVLGYLKGTIDYKVKLNVGNDLTLQSFADANWANEIDRKSVSGLAIIFGNALIGWKSRKQNIVPLSTAEAEYAALSYMCNEVTWYVQLMSNLV